MLQIWKKEQNDQCRVMVKKKQYWNCKYQIPDPIFPYAYELNIINPETS